MNLFGVRLGKENAPAVGPGLLGPRGSALKRPAPSTPECRLDPVSKLSFRQIPHHCEHYVLRCVVSLVEFEDLFAGEAAHGLFRADHGAAIGMDAIGGGEQISRSTARGQVVAALDLLADHFDFAAQFGGVESRVADCIGQDVDTLDCELAGQHQVVNGLVKRRPGVDFSPVGLDVPGDFSWSTPRGSLEEHVLVQVGKASLVGPFVGASSVDPRLECNHLRRMMFLKYNREAVAQLVAHSHRAANVSPRQRGCKETAKVAVDWVLQMKACGQREDQGVEVVTPGPGRGGPAGLNVVLTY